MKAIIFDFDGTLIDSVYAHALAWQKALAEYGIVCTAWEIHRRIGMSGTLLVKAVAREHGRKVSEFDTQRLDSRHSQLLPALAPACARLPGAVAFLACLESANIRHGIATSGKRAEMEESLRQLSLSPSTIIIDGDMVEDVKPEPEWFLLCQQKLKVEPAECLIVGDAIWDIHAARRSGILSFGLLSGGFGEQEL